MRLTILKASLLLIGGLSVLQTNSASPTQSSFKVSGRLIGNTTSGVTLRGPAGVLQGTVRPDGSFEFVGVVPGNHIANPMPRNPFGRPEQVRVQSSNIRDVIIQNPVIRRIAGRIVIQGGAPIPGTFSLGPPPPLPNLACSGPEVSPDRTPWRDAADSVFRD